MNKHFFYTRRQPIAPKEGSTEVTFREFTDSFNVDLVIRTHEMDDGRRYVILNDFHERAQEIPEVNPKSGKTTYVKRKSVVQSEIYLEKDDAENFVKIYEN
jgi:hypothetical protein